ncbi:hypothetical protein SNEBB_009727 [Seison nebaliae]|nr:hypothetical protein SNEBB_009727 [Seison nebaliae]
MSGYSASLGRLAMSTRITTLPGVTGLTSRKSLKSKSFQEVHLTKDSPMVSKKSMLPCHNLLSVSNGINRALSVRCVHSDIKVPSFDDYRKKDRLNPNEKMSKDDEIASRAYTYVAQFGTGVAVAYGAKATVIDLLSSMGAAADVMALSKLEVNLSDIPEGKNMVFKWRSKPLFICHRSQHEINRELKTDHTQLKDPERDEDRVQKPEWLIVLGICTHLGCVPIGNAGDFGGFYCPCHGSHYDKSGRIRRGPAPLNLEVPPYTFTADDVVVVG